MKELTSNSYQELIDNVRRMLAAGSSDEEIMNTCRIPRGYLGNLERRFLADGGTRGPAPDTVRALDSAWRENHDLRPDPVDVMEDAVKISEWDRRQEASDAATQSQLAKKHKMTPDDVLKAVTRIEKASDKAQKQTSLDEDRQVLDNAYWRREYFTLRGKYDKVLQSDVALDRLCATVREMAPTSYDTAPYTGLGHPVADHTSPQAAVLLLSDTHVGKVTYPDQTLGFGQYSIQTYLDRLQMLEDSVCSILTGHVNCEISELHVLMLGDMVDGNLNHGNEADQLSSLQTQWNVAAHSLAQFLRNVKRLFPKVIVTPVTGNHARWSAQRRVPTKFKNSSVDGIVYDLAQALTKEVTGIEWNIDNDPSKLVRINGSLFFVAHGDHLSGGDRALGIPSHTIARQVNALSQKLAVNGQGIPHYYCFGHFHREMTLPHANGKIFVNGGFPGQDEYSMKENFAAAPPEQKLLLIHPRYRMTANWPIYLEHAPAGSSRYTMDRILK